MAYGYNTENGATIINSKKKERQIIVEREEKESEKVRFPNILAKMSQSPLNYSGQIQSSGSAGNVFIRTWKLAKYNTWKYWYHPSEEAISKSSQIK